MDAATQLREDGFVIVDRFLDEGELAEVEHQLARFIDQVVPHGKPGLVVYEAGSDKKISHLSNLEMHDPYWKDLLNRPRTIELLEACLGTDVEPLASEVFYKPARVGSAAPPHQDNAYMHFNPPDGIAVWVALDEVTLDNGCIWYAKGTHKLGDLRHVSGETPPFSKLLADPVDTSKNPEVPALLKPGGAVIHHLQTVHRSGPNRTDHNRRGLVLNYKGINFLPLCLRVPATIRLVPCGGK